MARTGEKMASESEFDYAVSSVKETDDGREETGRRAQVPSLLLAAETNQ